MRSEDGARIGLSAKWAAGSIAETATAIVPIRRNRNR
jgi:hypothetical protein